MRKGDRAANPTQKCPYNTADPETILNNNEKYFQNPSTKIGSIFSNEDILGTKIK